MGAKLQLQAEFSWEIRSDGDCVITEFSQKLILDGSLIQTGALFR